MHDFCEEWLVASQAIIKERTGVNPVDELANKHHRPGLKDRALVLSATYLADTFIQEGDMEKNRISVEDIQGVIKNIQAVMVKFQQRSLREIKKMY